MATYNAVQEVGATLVNVLWNSMKKDPKIKPAVLQSKNDIKVDDVTNLENGGRLTLYLYCVGTNPEMRNRPLELKSNGDDHTQSHPPLPLDLYYLVIPHTQTVEKDHVLLGKVMQVFYDNAILEDPDLQGSLKGSGQRLRVVPNPMDSDEMNKLWVLFKEQDYKLCISYLVTPVKIDSGRFIPTYLVEEPMLVEPGKVDEEGERVRGIGKMERD